MDTELQIRELVATKLEVPLDRVTMEADFIIDLGGDSLTLAELTAAVEQEMGKRIPVDRLWDIATVGDMKQLLDDLDVPGESSGG